MLKRPRTDEELIDDIRASGNLIDEHWDRAFSIVGKVDFEGLVMIESHANALHIYCKLLRQQLEAQQPTTGGE